jgi:hypothetical protein
MTHSPLTAREDDWLRKCKYPIFKGFVERAEFLWTFSPDGIGIAILKARLAVAA